jgi:iron complex transport system substrate-binding protein
VEVPPAENFDQIRSVTRMVAHAVGEEARGEALIAGMDADLAELAAHRPKKILTVAGWGGGGYVPGTGGLFDAMLTAAGARNVERGGYYDVEALIAANPDALVYGDTYSGTTSLRADQDLHPALLKRYAGRRISYASLYGCGVPQSARVARQLQDALRAAAP